MPRIVDLEQPAQESPVVAVARYMHYILYIARYMYYAQPCYGITGCRCARVLRVGGFVVIRFMDLWDYGCMVVQVMVIQ